MIDYSDCGNAGLLMSPFATPLATPIATLRGAAADSNNAVGQNGLRRRMAV